MLTFRGDIQGLRTIAVLAVVIFHINPELLPGGYIGVDIFFVISGYLIMGIIYRDLSSGDFSLLSFYSRRVRRLFPALFVVVAMSSITAYFILLPNENIDFNKSLISTFFYLSNFYFYLEADYFNEMMEFAPLLHTWSLSVEEQFYLIFPFILIYIFRNKRANSLAILITLAIFSLIVSQIAIDVDKSFAFFASPTRFFQFILGGIVAIHLQKSLLSKSINDIMGAVGLAIIISCMFLYDDKTPFPGINALLPSIATALMLFVGSKSSYLDIFLSNRLFRWIGDSSYSIYLWHWPLIVFYKLGVSPSLDRFEQLGLLLGSLLFGYTSYRFIEKKTRLPRSTNIQDTKIDTKPIYLTVAVSLIASAIALLIIHRLSMDSKEHKKKAYEYLDYNTSNFRSGECFLTSKYNNIKFYDKKKCITHNKDKRNYLLLGDSHAAHFYSALAKATIEDETMTQVTASGCHPTLPYDGTQRCQDLFRWAYEELITQKRFDTIILSAHWAYPEKEYLLRVIKLLSKYTDRIVIFGPNMEYLQSLPRLLVELPEGENPEMIYKTAGNYKSVSSVDYHMKSYLRGVKGVEYISILHTLCDRDSCRTTTLDGTPILFDSGHLTHDGAYFIIKQIEDEIFDR